jgi:hypothetical protein
LCTADGNENGWLPVHVWGLQLQTRDAHYRHATPSTNTALFAFAFLISCTNTMPLLAFSKRAGMLLLSLLLAVTNPTVQATRRLQDVSATQAVAAAAASQNGTALINAFTQVMMPVQWRHNDGCL